MSADHSGKLRRLTLSAVAVVGVAGGLVAVAGISGVTAVPRTFGPADLTGPETGVAAKAATADPERQSRLVTDEDQRITRAILNAKTNAVAKKKAKPYRAKANGQYTLVLTARRRAYSWDDLRKLSADTLIPQADGSFLLREHILVGPGATLSISPGEPLNLKMSSGPEGFVSIVTDGGRIRLNGTAAAPISIQSWDESRGRVDAKLGDGRAYLRASGQLVVTNTKFSRLGFWSGRTGGVAVVSAAGSAPSTDLDTNAAAGTTDEPVARRGGSNTDILPAGKLPGAAADETGSYASSVTDSSMTGNAFGLFLSGASGPQVKDTVISKSLVDGLVLHRNVDAATISGVRVERSAVDGVVINRNVEGTVLTRLDVRNNGRDGVVMSGSPLADGPSASGASPRPFGNNVLTTSKSTDNGRIGVHVAGGVAVTVQGNTVSGGHSGIVVSDRAEDVIVNSNTVKDSRVNGIQVRDDSRVELTSNNVIGAATGVHVRDAVAALRDNSTSGVTLHAITFVGAVAGSVADGNQLRGSGTTAIDLVRVSGDAPKVSDTDDSGWSRTVTKDSLVSILLHPLTMVWIGIGVLLVLMSRPRRGGTREPYRADPLVGKGGPAGDHPPVAAPAREREIPVHTYAEQASQQGSRQASQQPEPRELSEPAPALVETRRIMAPVTPRVIPAHPQPSRRQQQPVSARRAGFPEYADPEPPVAAEWLQPPHHTVQPTVRQPVVLPRQQAEVADGQADPVGSVDSSEVQHADWDRQRHWDQQDEWDQQPAWQHQNGWDRQDDWQRQPAERTPAAGSTVIDLAIAESRLNPATPRRRRVVGR